MCSLADGVELPIWSEEAIWVELGRFGVIFFIVEYSPVQSVNTKLSHELEQHEVANALTKHYQSQWRLWVYDNPRKRRLHSLDEVSLIKTQYNIVSIYRRVQFKTHGIPIGVTGCHLRTSFIMAVIYGKSGWSS